MPSKKSNVPHGSPSVVSIFSGGGGLDLGLEAAGFESVFVSDIDRHSCVSLENGKKAAEALNLPFLRRAKVVQKDIRDLTSTEILESTGLKKGELDLLAGGPPCQAFSVFGKRLGTADPRGLLPYEYLRLLRELNPKAFIFENVFGLLTIHGGDTFKELCRELERPSKGQKYGLSIFRLNAADYGVPQFRDRVFIIGSRQGKRIESIPKICSGSADESNLPPYRTVGQALKGMPPLGQKLPNHFGREHSERIIKRYKDLKPGQRDPKTRINKLDPSRPSFTIIVGSDKGGGKGHVHPLEPREVSPRESARIQTFPDWWAFSGTSRHPIRQVGNAVPPLMAAAIGRELLREFFDKPRRPWERVLHLLGQEHLF